MKDNPPNLTSENEGVEELASSRRVSGKDASTSLLDPWDRWP